jgi:hypothetical protein
LDSMILLLMTHSVSESAAVTLTFFNSGD